MTISISGAIPASAVSAGGTSSSSPTLQTPHNAAENSADTVKLSQAAQVHLFKQEGQSLSQIANNLSISMATVDGYLGIAVPKAASAPVAAQTPVPVQSGAGQPVPQPAKS